MFLFRRFSDRTDSFRVPGRTFWLPFSSEGLVRWLFLDRDECRLEHMGIAVFVLWMAGLVEEGSTIPKGEKEAD